MSQLNYKETQTEEKFTLKNLTQVCMNGIQFYTIHRQKVMYIT